MSRSQYSGDDDLPDLSLRRRVKDRPEKGSDSSTRGSENSNEQPPGDGTAEDRRARLSRSTKEEVYKNPPWGGGTQKAAPSHPPANTEGRGPTKGNSRQRGGGARGRGRGGKVPTGSIRSKATTNDSPMDVDDQEHESHITAKRKRAESASTAVGMAEESQTQSAKAGKSRKQPKKPKTDIQALDEAQQKLASRTPRRLYASAKIDEDAPSSDEDESQPEPQASLPPKYARKKLIRAPAQPEDSERTLLNEDGEDIRGSAGSAEAEESGEEVEERDNIGDARIDFVSEAVTTSFARVDKLVHASEDGSYSGDDDNENRGPVKRGHRAPGATSRAHARTMSSDEDVFSAADAKGKTIDYAPVPAPVKKQRGQTRREQKLQAELPVLSLGKEMKSKAKSTRKDAQDDGEDRPWFLHTDITDALVATSKTSWTISLTLLNPIMAEVVREALRLGAIALEIGAPNMTLESMNELLPYTPFQAKGLNQYGIDALITAAEKLGYGSRNDVAHRLEAGSTATYIHPPASYVGGRLRSFRGSIKTAAIQVVPGALRLPDGPDNTRDRTSDELKSLATDVNFLFPMNSRTGDFDDSRPFSGAGIKEIIKAAFFVDKQWYNVGLSNLRLFRATENFPADEPEVTPVMLALAATALEATLRDMTNSGEQDFAGNLYHDSFKDHLETALEFRHQKPSNYHKLTHELLVYASNGRVRPGASASAGSGRPRRARINWDAIQEPDA